LTITRITRRSIRALVAAALGGLAACATPDAYQGPLVCPYSPAYQHAYRHGVLPTIETNERMRVWYGNHRAAAASNTLAFGGGVDGIGVTSGTPRVYLVFFGSQWTGSGDPRAAATYLQNFFKGIGTGGELWSGTMTQYCDGPGVMKGATSCPAGAPHVGYPSSGALAGVWFDTAAAAPGNATIAQLSAEAVKAAGHFGNTTASANRFAQYLIVSPSGTHPDGFGPNGGFCAWHDFTTSALGDIAYANLPYVSDLAASCGENFVNSGAIGALDGFSIVGGHEYAETLTDQNPAGGWTNPTTGEEDGDLCAWISSGRGASANVSMGNGAYAMQSTWSNDTNGCDISHALQ
jgi:serine protease